MNFSLWYVFVSLYLLRSWIFFRTLALDKEKLKKIKITHIVNAAQGKKFSQIDTSEDYYEDIKISYHGIPAMDSECFKMTEHFKSAALFIHNAIHSKGTV